MSIKRIDLRHTGIRITLAAVFGGTLLGLYYAFNRPQAVTEQPPAPVSAAPAPPAEKPPETRPQDDLAPKLRLSTSTGTGKGSLLPGVANPALKLSGQTALDSNRQPAQTPPPGNADLALGTSTSLTAAPTGKVAEPESRAGLTSPLRLTVAPLRLTVAEDIGTRTGTDSPPPRRDLVAPLRLSIAEEMNSLPAGTGLELDASPVLTAAVDIPALPEPQPGAPTRRDSAPVLPTSDRNASRRAALTENKETEGNPTSADTTASSATTGTFGWRIPPIRWGGEVGLQMNQNRSSGGSQSSDLQEFINLRASSYIYQPWMAQVSGNVMLSTSNGKSSSNSQTTTSSSQNVSGGGTLNLFPVSRFPALVTYDVSNSNSTSGFSGTDSTTTRFGVRQSYRPESSAYNMSGGFNTSTISSSTQGDDQVNAMFGNFSTRIGTHHLSTNANFSESTGSSSGQSSSLFNLNATHGYQARENLRFDSLATLNDNTQTFLSSDALSKTRGRTMQLNSNASWHPEEDDEGNIIPLNVNAGARATSFQNDSAGSATTLQSLSANAAANYNYTPNLALSGNGLVTQISGSGTASQVFTLLGAGANYSGDPLTFGKFSYNWNAGANGSQQTGGSTPSNLTLNENAGHALSRAITLSKASSMGVNLGQNVTHSSSSLSGQSTSLSHNAGATYNTELSDRASGSAGLNLSDTISTGANASHYTNLDLNTQGQIQFNTRSSGNLNMSLQRSASNTSSLDGPDNRTVTTNLFGAASYQHQRAFGVPGLRYNASFGANTSSTSDEQRLAGDVNAENKNVSYVFENRFDYRIGLLEFQLRGAINSTSGQKNALIFFRVTRDLGGF